MTTFSKWALIQKLVRFLSIIVLILLVASACQPDATPVPNVAPPTATDDTKATLAPPIRYVLGTAIQNMDSIRDQIAQSALLIPVSGLSDDSQLGADYDIIADYGLMDGWEQSPVVPTVSLIINPNLAPLNDDAIANIIRTGVDGSRVVTQMAISGTLPMSLSTLRLDSLKTEFANMGYPDGFVLQIGIVEIPQSTALLTDLNGLNIDLHAIEGQLDDIVTSLTENRIHLALVKWHSVTEKAVWTNAVGEINVIDLYQLPISYLATPNLNISFADNGFPIASY